jgi:hypothetical protein
VLLAGGRGGTQQAKKYPTRKAYIHRKLVLLHWAKKIAHTPKYGFADRKNYCKAIYLASRCANKCKTDKSKRRIVGFGGKVLTDEKSG